MDEKLLKHGAFSWFELMTTDVEAAKKFYSEVLGWTTKDMPMEGMTYTMAQVEGQDVGGIMNIPPEGGEMPPTWGVYITVKDVDAAATKVKELNGKVFIEPRDIPNVGRFCVIQDPQGAFVSLISYSQ